MFITDKRKRARKKRANVKQQHNIASSLPPGLLNPTLSLRDRSTYGWTRFIMENFSSLNFCWFAKKPFQIRTTKDSRWFSLPSVNCFIFITFFQHTCTYDLDTLSFFPPSRFSWSRLHMSVEWPTLNKYETNNNKQTTDSSKWAKKKNKITTEEEQKSVRCRERTDERKRHKNASTFLDSVQIEKWT